METLLLGLAVLIVVGCVYIIVDVTLDKPENYI